MKQLRHIYTSEFYKNQTLGSVTAAKEILKILFEFYKPISVIDIGCGRGSWLTVAESLGSKYLRGIDGNWVNKNELLSKNIKFSSLDLEKQFNIDEKFDLCISIEVAEHLSKTRSKTFIETLCNLSDIVLFSAAIKYQGGPNHINEQWPSYWIDLFGTNDFKCYDIFRYKIWNNENIEWWFRQNVFLFVNNCSIRIDTDFLNSTIKPICDIVHPKNYEDKILSYTKPLNDPTMGICINYLKQFVMQKIKMFFKKK